MSEVLCAAPLIRGTEFILDDQGVRLFGTCGQRALASAASSALGTAYPGVSTLGIYDSMRNHGWADAGGACTIGDLQSQAQLMNIPVASFVQYNEPWNSWQMWLTAQIQAGNPCVLEVAAGQALVDVVSGKGENAVNLQYHFIAILGMNAPQYLPGFWSADGDNFAGNNDNAHGFAAADVLQYYTASVLGNARPCGGLALKGRAIKMAWTKQGDGTGKDDAGHICGVGFMAELTAKSEASVDGLMSETYMGPEESFLPLANGDVYTYTKATNTVATNQGAQVAVKLYQLWEAAEKAAIPSSPPAISTPSDPTATALVAAIKAALAA